MKLLTINTHSIIEPDYESKLDYFIKGIINYSPDIIAMQEVNQSVDGKIAAELPGFVQCTTRTVRDDNHALRAVKRLCEMGMSYHWTWEPIKIGYGKYEEGLAILSRYPIKAADSIYISTDHDRNNWKTRKLLGIETVAGSFYTVHMGWWDDDEEPFTEQWHRVDAHVKSKDRAWLMGDFNSPDDVRGEGYDEVVKSGWRDVYRLARRCDDGFTVVKQIDGWESDKKMRIDYIWCNSDVRVKSAGVMFDDKNERIVSDHYGVAAEVEYL